MIYTITMTIGTNRYDDKIRSEATFEADGLQRPTLHAIATAMVNDVTEKADAKRKLVVSSAPEEITPPPAPSPKKRSDF